MFPPVPIVRVLLYVISSVLTSNPGGGVINKPLLRLSADKLKLVDADGNPWLVVNAARVPIAPARKR